MTFLRNAAPIRGLSNLSPTNPKCGPPVLPSSAACESVHDHSRAWLRLHPLGARINLVQVSPKQQHKSASLVTRPEHVPNSDHDNIKLRVVLSRARPLARKTFTSVPKVKNPPFRPFSRMPHPSAALVASPRHTPDPHNPAYRVTRRAKTCAATHVSNPQSFLLESRTANSALSSERCICARTS